MSLHYYSNEVELIRSVTVKFHAEKSTQSYVIRCLNRMETDVVKIVGKSHNQVPVFEEVKR